MKITKKNVHEIYRALCNRLCELKDDDVLIDNCGVLYTMSIKSSIGPACIRTAKISNFIIVEDLNKTMDKSGISFDGKDVLLTPKQFSQIFNVDEDQVLVWICKTLVDACLENTVGYYCGTLAKTEWYTAIPRISCLEELMLNDALYPRESRAA